MKSKNLLPTSNLQLLTSRSGFTLIEVITAIGVLAVLASAVIAALDPLEQFKKSQDSRRKSDLAQIQRSLEAYYNDNDRYPASYLGNIAPDGTANTAVTWGGNWRPYMDVVPIDPVQNKNYAYWADPNGQSYAIYASLDRGARDPQACEAIPCTNSAAVTCGAGVCDFGVSSSNIAP